MGAVPVISSIALGFDGEYYNINADEMAAACAIGTKADALVFLTDVPGVKGADGNVMRWLSLAADSGDGKAAGRLRRHAAETQRLPRCAHPRRQARTYSARGGGAATCPTCARPGSTMERRSWSHEDLKHRSRQRRRSCCSTPTNAIPYLFVSGQGVYLRDENGKDYLDLLSGIGVSALGYGHPAVEEAIDRQSKRLLHTSNLFFHEHTAELALRLTEISGLDRVFFCN